MSEKTYIPYADDKPELVSYTVQLGRFARERCGIPAPPEPPAEKVRATHDIGKITAFGHVRNGRPPAPKLGNDCDHSQYRRMKHDIYRFRCGGCKTLLNFSEAA